MRQRKPAVRRRPGFWLILLMGCCVAWSTGVARAQVSVTVTHSVAIAVSAGASISDAGDFTVTNSSGATITINSINLSVTDAGVFSSLSMTGQVPGFSAVVVQSSPNPPGTSNTFDFSALPALPNGQTATFSLSGTAALAPTSTPSPGLVDLRRSQVTYAGIMWPLPERAKMPAGVLTALALGALLMTGKLRRRHLILLAIAVVLAATEVGCGNGSNFGGSSTQTVQTITVSSGGTPTGLPANLGSITVQ